MTISKEPSRILLNLLNLEPNPSIRAILHETSGKRTSQAANTDTALVVANWVGEGETRGPGGAARGLMDVCCGGGGGLVGASYVEEGDVLLFVVRNVSGKGKRVNERSRWYPCLS
jgi:hypothetical protein